MSSDRNAPIMNLAINFSYEENKNLVPVRQCRARTLVIKVN